MRTGARVWNQELNCGSQDAVPDEELADHRLGLVEIAPAGQGIEQEGGGGE